MQNQVRVAVVQAGSILIDKEANIDKAVSLTRAAANRGAKIVLFPEAFIPGHPRVLNFGLKGGQPTAEGRRLRDLYRQNSLSANDPALAPLAKVAAETGVFLAVGLTEWSGGGRFYCSLFFWSPKGDFLGQDRKIKLTGTERQVWDQGDFNVLTVLETTYGKTGTILSGENYLPLMRAALYARWVSLYLAPTSEAKPTWQCTIRHIALEGQCFVLSCNQYLSREMIPEDLGADFEATEREQICQGGSAIVGPCGEYLAGPLFNQEGILTADLDLAQIDEVRKEFDPSGHFGHRSQAN
ncbi:MAG: carbon-nitrogen hydrolase family protein [Candidatus Adiutrix sp.]|jgi:nitrilase|nr:carbon-nitrogen hydrolase family protein [Candidatus Adiutrix sp.]